MLEREKERRKREKQARERRKRGKQAREVRSSLTPRPSLGK
jgi:hypothetical protein